MTLLDAFSSLPLLLLLPLLLPLLLLLLLESAVDDVSHSMASLQVPNGKGKMKLSLTKVPLSLAPCPPATLCCHLPSCTGASAQR